MHASFGGWKRLIPSRFRLLHLVILVMLCISCTWILSTFWLPEERNIASIEPEVRANIIKLSLDYVRLLARAQKHTPDGPYHADGTNYDMKKTMAVLLNDMHQRITKLETELQAQIDRSSETKNRPDSSSSLSSIPSQTQRRLHTVRVSPNSEVNTDPVDFIALLQGVQEGCVVNSRKMLSYPECQSKMDWLRKGWRSDPCYSQFGVDGTDCSFIRYLSEMESFCPAIEDRVKYSNKPLAQITYDLDGLLTRIQLEPGHHLSHQFMRNRITRMWSQWVEGVRRYAEWNEPANDYTSENARRGLGMTSPNAFSPSAPGSTSRSTTSRFGQPHFHNRSQMKIHLHLSFISFVTSLGFERSIGRGGPLGELVQWTDLLAGLYLLGHDVTLSIEPSVLLKHLHFDQYKKSACQVEQNVFDLIFTDISGYRRLVKQGVRIPKCKFRILDSFGTEARFNRDRKNTSWGGLRLNLKQFYTMFPHSPDNTFLGFVVETTANSTNSSAGIVRSVSGKPIALVYGKEAYMWQNAHSYLLVLSEFFELHANVRDTVLDKMFGFVHVHNFSHGVEYTNLMKSAKVFVGLGFPYEGPAPLEAIANGVIFLNPHFKDPHHRSNTKFFADKPTSRKLTSQHPYIEQYVGEPYSYLVDMNDPAQIRQTVKRMLERPAVPPHIPFEYTTTGFIERLNALLSRQLFCTAPERLHLLHTPAQLNSSGSSSSTAIDYLDLEANVVRWPPLTANTVQFIRGSPDASCVDTCASLQSDLTHDDALNSTYLQRRAQYVLPETQSHHCAPEHFTTANHYTLFESVLPTPVHCAHIRSEANTAAPYWDASNGTCVLQSDRLLFDCTARPPHPAASRLCPCRGALPGQRSLCANCV